MTHRGSWKCLRKTYYCVLHNILPTDKMAEKKFTLAENGSQKICICRKKAVPL